MTWAGGASIFMVDDNFIGNKRNVKLMLKALAPLDESDRAIPLPFLLRPR